MCSESVSSGHTALQTSAAEEAWAEKHIFFGNVLSFGRALQCSLHTSAADASQDAVMLHTSAADTSQNAALPAHQRCSCIPGCSSATQHNGKHLRVAAQQSGYAGPAAQQHQWDRVTGIAVVKGELVPCNTAEQSVVSKKELWCCGWSG